MSVRIEVHHQRDFATDTKVQKTHRRQWQKSGAKLQKPARERHNMFATACRILMQRALLQPALKSMRNSSQHSCGTAIADYNGFWPGPLPCPFPRRRTHAAEGH
jgi:hypothetical protein